MQNNQYINAGCAYVHINYMYPAQSRAENLAFCQQKVIIPTPSLSKEIFCVVENAKTMYLISYQLCSSDRKRNATSSIVEYVCLLSMKGSHLVNSADIFRQKLKSFSFNFESNSAISESLNLFVQMKRVCWNCAGNACVETL